MILNFSRCASADLKTQSKLTSLLKTRLQLWRQFWKGTP